MALRSRTIPIDVRSILLLVFSIALLCAGGWLVFTDQAPVTASACVRSGAVLFAVWLAMPQLRKLKWSGSLWLFGSAIVVLGVLAIRPKALIIVGPVLLAIGLVQFVGWLFAPMPGAKSRRADP